MAAFELREEESKEIVRKWFPVLLKEDIAFREEVMDHLTGVLATKDDIARILSKQEEHSETLKEFAQVLDEHTMSINKFDRTLSAVGSRWGILAEESFRAAMRGVIEDLGYQVKKWRVRDEDGKVYGHSTMVEADILIINGQALHEVSAERSEVVHEVTTERSEHILMEIKSSVSTGDVSAFARVSQVYEDKEKVKPRLVMVSPFIDARAQFLGEQLGMELYTSPEEVVE